MTQLDRREQMVLSILQAMLSNPSCTPLSCNEDKLIEKATQLADRLIAKLDSPRYC